MFRLLKLLKRLSPVKLYVSTDSNMIAFEVAKKKKKKGEGKMAHSNRTAREITFMSLLKSDISSRRSTTRLDHSLVNDKVKAEPEHRWRHVYVHLREE